MEATQAAQALKEVKIGDYVLTGKIGQGGIAEIYKARQSSLDRDVAIKVLSSKLSSDPDLVRRFERETTGALDDAKGDLGGAKGD